MTVDHNMYLGLNHPLVGYFIYHNTAKLNDILINQQEIFFN